MHMPIRMGHARTHSRAARGRKSRFAGRKGAEHEVPTRAALRCRVGDASSHVLWRSARRGKCTRRIESGVLAHTRELLAFAGRVAGGLGIRSVRTFRREPRCDAASLLRADGCSGLVLDEANAHVESNRACSHTLASCSRLQVRWREDSESAQFALFDASHAAMQRRCCEQMGALA